MLIALAGLFFTGSIAGVRRWYRIPILNFNAQPSEFAKLVVVIALSWYLEKQRSSSHRWSTVFGSAVIVGLPFILILKQPDLGTALILYPTTLAMFYFGELKPVIVRWMSVIGSIALVFVALIFLGLLPHESVKPWATLVLKEYQFDRLDPNTHHQKVAAMAIAVGGVSGTGWGKGELTAHGWLPAPYTDSVFPAFGEEFGLLGLAFLLFLLYALVHLAFQTVAVAPDHFGRLLAAGIAVYLTMHIVMNIGMMCGFLPITGVPLILVTYGGSSILWTMIALGLLQSIHRTRFMF